MSLRVIVFDPERRGWKELSKDYQRFHAGEPWNEYLWCPNCCGSADPYGPAGAIGLRNATSLGLIQGAVCTRCRDGRLQLFWSHERTRAYFINAKSRSGFQTAALEDKRGRLAGWAWGYTGTPPELVPLLGPDAFYLDVIAVLPSHRHLLRTAITLFRHFLDGLVEKNSHICMRTHSQAHSLRHLARLAGFVETGIPSKADPTRDYWLYIGTRLSANDH